MKYSMLSLLALSLVSSSMPAFADSHSVFCSWRSPTGADVQIEAHSDFFGQVRYNELTNPGQPGPRYITRAKWKVSGWAIDDQSLQISGVEFAGTGDAASQQLGTVEIRAIGRFNERAQRTIYHGAIKINAGSARRQVTRDAVLTNVTCEIR